MVAAGRVDGKELSISFTAHAINRGLKIFKRISMRFVYIYEHKLYPTEEQKQQTRTRQEK